MWDIAGGPAYDIAEMFVFKNNKDGTFGPMVEVPSINLVTVRFNYKRAQATGNLRITAVNAQIESATLTFRNFSISQEVLGILMSVGTSLKGSTPNRQRRLKMGNRRMKFFGMAARTLTGDEGDTHILLPYCIVDSSFDWSFQYNDFVQPQMQATAMADPVLLDDDDLPLIIDVMENEAETELEVPFDF